MESPLVTIRCITYNHEPFIRQCLEGFVMQQTNFKFEAVVHDDASTDCTAAIISEFAVKYPDIIKPLYEEENQYSKKDGSLARIMDTHMHGKYIAMCEGDDYWTEPTKLQQQVEFLESNPEYSLCFHKTDVKSLDGRKRDSYAKLKQREYSIDELLKEWKVPTCSILVRSEVMFNRPTHKDFNTGDVLLVTTAARYGKLYCLEKTMGVHIMHIGGVSNDLKLDTFVPFWKAMLECFPEFSKTIIPIYRKLSIRLFLCNINNKSRSAISLFKEFGFFNIICSLCIVSMYKVYRLIINNNK